MGTYVVIKPDGSIERVPGGRKIELAKLYELIGCHTVEVTPVQFEGRKRDCWLDEEGLLTETIVWNPHVRALAQEYWAKHGVHPYDVQGFAGTGVVWLPKA
jgi:hypothetical protein